MNINEEKLSEFLSEEQLNNEILHGWIPYSRIWKEDYSEGLETPIFSITLEGEKLLEKYKNKWLEKLEEFIYV